MRMDDSHSSYLVGGNSISIPILDEMKSYSFLIFKFHSDFDFNSSHKLSILQDMTIPILVLIYIDSNVDYDSNHEANVPSFSAAKY